MKEKSIFECTICGYQSTKWLGKCPDCNNWNSLEEITVSANKKRNPKSAVKTGSVLSKLNEVKGSKSDRIITSINEFNRVMGGGIVRDSLTILTAPPGGGKSTLTLMIADDLAKKGYKVLYASGEESESQIKNRADRILDSICENIWIISDDSMDNVLEAIKKVEPDLIIIDSIQTFTLEEFLPARAGNPTQTMQCANELLKVAKSGDKPRAVIVIGQMNKSDQISGLRALEHLVDAVLLIEGETEEELRAVLATKNRFGNTGEMGFFHMTEKGMVSIDNPSQFFMTKRNKEELISGSALTVIREGSRPIIVEIESLVSNSYTPYPSRIAESIGKEKLNTLISILEQRSGANLYNKNVVIKVTGGLRIKEPSINLATIMSIASALYDKGISNDIVFIADVGLTGELKRVPALEGRLKELDRMGFGEVYVAKGATSKSAKFENIIIKEVNTLKEVINDIFKN
jgi:DNA repair protein RadA/Sms